MNKRKYHIFARQVADGCFTEVKSKEKRKQVISFLLLITLLMTTLLSNIYLYIATFLAFVFQILYVLEVRDTKVLNAKAQEAHKLRLYFTLFKNYSIFVELANLHSSFKIDTMKKIESKKYDTFDDTTPHEINRVRKLYWILQENSFYNRTLYQLERNVRIKYLLVILFILISILTFHSYFDIISPLNNKFLSIDIYTLPRFAFIAFSSFKVIELIDEAYDFNNGSIEMENLYKKIEKLSKKPKIDELLTIISNYYSILRQTPNISDSIYNKHHNKLHKNWEYIYKNALITKHKKEIIDTLKMLSGLLCDDKNWCVIGSTARFLQGEDVLPNDIDILTNEEGMNNFLKYCSAFIYEKPMYRKEENISSVYGFLMINNISIDIMTNLKGKLLGEWTEFPFENTPITIIKYDCLELKLRDIQNENDIQIGLN